jgi:hypothetical protein
MKARPCTDPTPLDTAADATVAVPVGTGDGVAGVVAAGAVVPGVDAGVPDVEADEVAPGDGWEVPAAVACAVTDGVALGVGPPGLGDGAAV